MLIEKRYFDIAKREDEEIEMELEAEKAKMTEEEKLEEKKSFSEIHAERQVIGGKTAIQS